MIDQKFVSLGEVIFSEIDSNPYLNELYENILYNYSINLLNIDSIKKPVNVDDALRFADILSKSNIKDTKKSDKHKLWAQEIVALLKKLEPENQIVDYYYGSVLSTIGNYRGIKRNRQIKADLCKGKKVC